MDRTSPEAIAYRREWSSFSVTFIATAILVIVAVAFFSVRQIAAEHNWWLILPAVLCGLFFPPVIGAATAFAFMQSLRWWHHRMGVYRCPDCQAALPLAGHCQCWLARHPDIARYIEAHKRLPWRFTRHLRRQIPRFAIIAVALAAPALVISLNVPAKNHNPLWLNFWFMYAVLTHLAGLVGMIACDHLKRSRRARRFRLRFGGTFAAMLAGGTLLLLIAAEIAPISGAH